MNRRRANRVELRADFETPPPVAHQTHVKPAVAVRPGMRPLKRILMQDFIDHDGKSKTASAVDADQYPEMDSSPKDSGLAHRDIARFAHDLWVQRGCPSNSSERDWLEAEEQLRKAESSRNQLQNLHDKGGSVQP
jgi:hypothetical protein